MTPRAARWSTSFRACCATAMLLAAAASFAHTESSNDIVVELDALPAALRGMAVSLQKTLTHQLVIENRTDRPLEVLSTSGEPFLRIGPGGVEADLAAAEWYRTYTSIGAPAPRAASVESTGARWTQVSPNPAWGWFDLRLRTQRLTVPHEVLHAGQPATIGRWQIPVRFEGVPFELTGRFRYVPPPTGYFSARLTGASEISPGVRLQILAGQRLGLFLENRSSQPVTIFGSAGEPFLTVGPSGVLANVLSPSWHASGQAETTAIEAPADAAAEPRWQERAAVPRISWLDSRLNFPQAQVPEAVRRGSQPQVVHRWEITFRHGEQLRKVTGVTDWLPFTNVVERDPSIKTKPHQPVLERR